VEVMAIFSSSKFGEIAGCLVRRGTVRRNSRVSVERQEQLIAQNLVVESLRRFKEDVTEVKEGLECGVGLQNFSGLEVGDYILVMERREVPRT
jgi:translation initiation factor IF-2